jgi:hypothetical protein
MVTKHSGNCCSSVGSNPCELTGCIEAGLRIVPVYREQREILAELAPQRRRARRRHPDAILRG